MLKKNWQSIIFICVISLFFVSPALAIGANGETAAQAAEYRKGNFGVDETATAAKLNATLAGKKSLVELISIVVGAALSMIGITFFLLALYGGIRWMTAHGDDTKVEGGRDTVIQATVGLIIVVGAYALTRFVLQSVGIAN